MNKILIAFVLLFSIDNVCSAQIFIDKTSIDSISSLPIVSITLKVDYWQGEQKVSDYNIDIGKPGKMKFKSPSGETIKVETFVDLINLMHKHGWELQSYSIMPFTTIKTGMEEYVRELLYFITFKKS